MDVFNFSHMDYITMSYRKVGHVAEIVNQAYDVMRVAEEVRPAPMYQEAYRLVCGAIVNMSWDEKQGSKMDVGGQALWNIRERTGWTDEFIIKMFSESQAKKRTTRLDYAFNTAGYARVNLLHWYIRAGKYNGNIKVAPSVYTPGSKYGQTIYFGSKDSEWRVRVYDKGHEMGLLSLAWARVEAQARAEYAQNAVEDVHNGLELADHFRARIKKSMGNINLRWWKQALDGKIEKIRTLIKKEGKFEVRMEQLMQEILKKAETPEQLEYIINDWLPELAMRLAAKSK